MTRDTIDDEPFVATKAETEIVTTVSENLIQSVLGQVDHDIHLALWAMSVALANLSMRSIGDRGTVDVFKSMGDFLDAEVTRVTKRKMN